MPRSGKQGKNTSDGGARPTAGAKARGALPLDHLPRLDGLVIEGGVRPLSVFVRENRRTVQPKVAIWLDANSGFIRSSRLLAGDDMDADDGVGATLAVLREALTGPFPPTPNGVADSIIEDADAAGLSELEVRRRAKAAKAGKAPKRRPDSALTPGLPATVRVNDEALLAGARDMLTPLGVKVEYTAEAQEFENAFASLSQALGASPDAQPPTPFAWDADTATLEALFKAANGLWRRAPWNYLPDFPPIGVALGKYGPQLGVETLYASILGGAGEVFGVAFYYEGEGLRRFVERGKAMMDNVAEIPDEELDMMIGFLRQSGFPIDSLPPEAIRDVVREAIQDGMMGNALTPNGENPQDMMEDSLTVFFTPIEESDPMYVEWLEDRGLKTPNRQIAPEFTRMAKGEEPRHPTARETQALRLALEALNSFFSATHTFFENELYLTDMVHLPLTNEAKLMASPSANPKDASAIKLQVEVNFPGSGFSIDDMATEVIEEDDLQMETPLGPTEPPSPEAQSTLYTMQVTFQEHMLQPKSADHIWRRIELRGDQTLHDLHLAIQDAFGWDDDHLYAFFMTGKAWDQRDAYYSPFDQDEELIASAVRIDELGLRARRTFMYLFDFGDELRHTVKVESVQRDGVQADVAYPRTIERHGDNVPQYPYAEEDDAGDEEGDNDDVESFIFEVEQDDGES
ncbi:MAG TPA: plasmid pRiA4b ORF-3 family protein [Ktedonobacterales bacterium]|nr:plasmid pRiA4b ORF-3 family protein [Ktedonobacterales bacterium]